MEHFATPVFANVVSSVTFGSLPFPAPAAEQHAAPAKVDIDAAMDELFSSVDFADFAEDESKAYAFWKAVVDAWAIGNRNALDPTVRMIMTQTLTDRRSPKRLAFEAALAAYHEANDLSFCGEPVDFHDVVERHDILRALADAALAIDVDLADEGIDLSDEIEELTTIISAIDDAFGSYASAKIISEDDFARYLEDEFNEAIDCRCKFQLIVDWEATAEEALETDDYVQIDELNLVAIRD
ncbi:hypothetical protein FY136_28575 (plasmid) [Agrobacterium tumefaciens]|uniref:hypothetical protein n=1 Tax=Agrobacterium tumefaciens TaxID=358 RepID=UPI0021D08695|nr:hypothetical protein [Agrobacterium tumefaciens]UXT53219.1 hypothetical protein FY136_28575 [Agrobacterium tumefaciens]